MLGSTSVLRNAVPHKAISASEFYDAFKKVWKQLVESDSRGRPLLGLAVSGGVDSMALAKLCVMMGQFGDDFRPHFHAFIVDHGARSGSHDEAQAVVSRVKDLGLPSTLLTLQWPLGIRPAELSNFETQARELRYRALGTACRERGILSLLLAHHADDQAESVLMRIAQKSQLNWTLRGMAGSEVNIPETWGIHGVHESGLQEFRHKFIERRRPRDKRITPLHRQASLPNRPSDEKSGLQIEEGGIKLYRPLLRFPKGRLQATCLQHQVWWFEDDTNRDITLTPRNAVRSLLEQRRVPRSLSPDALLQFADLMQVKGDSYEGQVEQLFRRTKILSFDLRSGRLIVRLPQTRRAYQDVPEPHKQSAYSHGKMRATMLLKRLVLLVTPGPNVRLSRLFPMVERMFTEFRDPDHGMLDEALMPTTFTAQGVRMERIDRPLESTDSNAKQGVKLDPKFVWSFTRQLYRRYSVLPSISLPPQRLPTLQEPSRLKYKDDSRWSHWQLWDGRYWIRVSNKTDKRLEIRPLRKTDIGRIKAQSHQYKSVALQKTLAVAAPGDTRWTLPIIAESGDSEKVVALPSLGFAIGHQREEISWQIRYKHVELSIHKDEDYIIR